MSDTDDTQDVDDRDDKSGGNEKDWKAEADKWKAHSRKHEGLWQDAVSLLGLPEGADKADLENLKNKSKSEAQRAADSAAKAEQRAQEAEAKLTRMEVALDKAPEGMPLAKVRKLAGRLSGDSREDLEADAEDLFADFAPDTGENGDDNDRQDTPRRPRERLRSGSAPSAEPAETDPEKLAATVPRMY